MTHLYSWVYYEEPNREVFVKCGREIARFGNVIRLVPTVYCTQTGSVIAHIFQGGNMEQQPLLGTLILNVQKLGYSGTYMEGLGHIFCRSWCNMKVEDRFILKQRKPRPLLQDETNFWYIFYELRSPLKGVTWGKIDPYPVDEKAIERTNIIAETMDKVLIGAPPCPSCSGSMKIMFNSRFPKKDPFYWLCLTKHDPRHPKARAHVTGIIPQEQSRFLLDNFRMVYC